MKFTVFVLCVLAAICCSVRALPAGRTSPDEDVELVDVRGQPKPAVHRRPVAVAGDDSSDGFEDAFNVDAILVPAGAGAITPFQNGFDPFFGINLGFVDRVQDILRNLYDQAGVSSLNPELDTKSEPGTVVASSDDKDGTKTTSTVKIINNHKYVINETVTIKHTPFGESVFKVRTVDILPLDDADKATEAGSTDSTADSTTPNTTEPKTDEKKKDGEAEGEAETVDRGSPEVLEPDHRRNEINSGRLVKVTQV